jgi:hypothetical protein
MYPAIENTNDFMKKDKGKEYQEEESQSNNSGR